MREQEHRGYYTAESSIRTAYQTFIHGTRTKELFDLLGMIDKGLYTNMPYGTTC